MRASALWENCFILILSMLYFKTQDQNSESTTLLHGDIGPPFGVPIVLGGGGFYRPPIPELVKTCESAK